MSYFDTQIGMLVHETAVAEKEWRWQRDTDDKKLLQWVSHIRKQ